MVTVKYTSPHYSPDKVGMRYVRSSVHAPEQLFYWCEQSKENPSRDICQGTCTADDLPPGVRQKAIARAGKWPSYVAWTEK